MISPQVQPARRIELAQIPVRLNREAIQTDRVNLL
jgi:hypothetical protein